MTTLKYITIPRKGMQTYTVYYCIIKGVLRKKDVSASSYNGVDAEFERLTRLNRKYIYKRIKK